MTQQDNELVQRIVNGDSVAENELFNRLADRIETIVRFRIGFDDERWEDVTYEVKLTILQKLRQGKFNPQKGNLISYIHGVTINKTREYFREQEKDKIIFQSSLQDDLNPIMTNEQNIEDEELKRLMRAVIKSLPVKYQEVIYLKFYQDLTVSQIAEKLNLEPRRISERIHYAIKKIQKKCAKDKNYSILSDYLSIYL